MTAPLEPEELVFIAICDLSAQVRGKSVPASDLSARLSHGVGYTPANICFSPFGTIGASPFGTLGDVVLLPDPSTEVHVGLNPRIPETVLPRRHRHPRRQALAVLSAQLSSRCPRPSPPGNRLYPPRQF